jgi:hypothetical protein
LPIELKVSFCMPPLSQNESIRAKLEVASTL